MAENKTKATGASVEKFLNAVKDETMRSDSFVLVELLKKATKQEPKMWGPSIVGFGQYHYKSERSSCEGDWPLMGFSPRAAALSIYIMPGFTESPELMAKLGKYKTGKSCLYVKKLSDIHVPTLKKLVELSLKQMKKLYPASA